MQAKRGLQGKPARTLMYQQGDEPGTHIRRGTRSHRTEAGIQPKPVSTRYADDQAGLPITMRAMVDAPEKKRRRLLRFSLRSLLLLVLLIASAGGLWWRWQPWRLLLRIGDYAADASFSPCG